MKAFLFKISFGFFFFYAVSVFSQAIKTFEGNYKEGMATYQYYEKDLKKVFEGRFSYSKKGINSITIEGAFEHDRKVGEWVYQRKAAKNQLVFTNKGNYSNGRRNGAWDYTVINTISGKVTKNNRTLHFKNDTLVGAVALKVINGQLDTNGKFIGHWKVLSRNYILEADFANNILISLKKYSSLDNHLVTDYFVKGGEETITNLSKFPMPLVRYHLGNSGQGFNFNQVYGINDTDASLQQDVFMDFFDAITNEINTIENNFIELNKYVLVNPQIVLKPGTLLEPLAEEKGVVYEIGSLDVTPEFEGGMASFKTFIAKNCDFNENAQGMLLAQFIVETDGSLSTIKILREVGFGTGKELTRVLMLSPKWSPGLIKGVAVRTVYTIPITITN